jgi:thymidylate synthase ThyX
MTTTDKPTNPYVYKDETGNWIITDAGHEFMAGKVTSTTAQVYAFTPEANPIEVAAAMARLSRRDGTLISCILDEFATTDEGADDLLDRVITSFGDDSVANLFSFYIVTESISNLATKQIEWSRIASYLEQSTRYIYYYQKQANGTYKYYRPDLPADLLAIYVETMDHIFDLYAEVVDAMAEYIRTQNPRPSKADDPNGFAAWPAATKAQACDAVRTMLPAATLSTVGIHASALSIDNMVKHLWAEPLPEMNELGTQILQAAKQVAPVFLRRTDQADRGLVDVAYRRDNRARMQEVAGLAETPVCYVDPEEVEVRITDFWPHKEEDFLPRLMLAESSRSLTQLRADIAVEKANSDEEAFAEYVATCIQAYCGDRLNRRHKPGRALEASAVEIEIVGDYGTFRDLQRHRMVSAFEWQRVSPYYGYDVPKLVVDAGLEDKFREAFEVSERLHCRLSAAGFEEHAQYAVCMGYRMRYSFVANVRELFHLLELRTSPQGHPGYRAICNEIYKQLQAIWPNIAAAMKFVNQADDLGELTRMASERNTAAKLAALGIEAAE